MFQVQHVVYTPQQNGPHEIHPAKYCTTLEIFFCLFPCNRGIHCCTLSTNLSFLNNYMNNYMTGLRKRNGKICFFFSFLNFFPPLRQRISQLSLFRRMNHRSRYCRKAVFRPSESEHQSENFLWCLRFNLRSFSRSLKLWTHLAAAARSHWNALWRSPDTWK